MSTPHRVRLGIGLATMALVITGAALSAAACVVGTGSSASCTDTALNACLPGGGSFDGTVTFNCGGPATIDISPGAGGTGTKTISANTTIDGGRRVTISGGSSVRVFSVNSGITFTVRNLTIANGDGGAVGSGGGIFNDGTLTVTNTTFTGNGANGGGGGIHNNDGTLTVIDSTFVSNGGGASGGGGIREGDSGPVHVFNSTFDNNGGNGGGGIRNDGGRVDVTNSTFTRNSGGLGGGGIYNDGTLTVTNSTLTDNAAGVGGGIRNANGTATLTNTIIANSTTGGDCVNNATVTDGGHNLIEDTGANACGLTNGVNGNLIGQDPNLDAAGLQSNGGPTQTVAVLTGSPAINAGDETVCAAAPVNGLDQRGFVRPGGGFPNCTIGAYEYAAQPPHPAPALSPLGLLGLAALLSATGWLLVWRKSHAASQAR